MGYLILLFTVVPALELALIIKVGSQIGAWNTIFLLVGMGILGSYLARMQGFLVMTRMQDSLRRGALPTQEMLDGFLIFAGGVLLLTPGFITDVFGLILLFPPTRILVKKAVFWKVQSMVKKGQMTTFRSPPRRDDIIDI